MHVSGIPAFEDNYIWLLSTSANEHCAVVDPGDEDPVIETLESKGLTLDAILITHKHGDHVGGIEGLKQRWPNAVVYAPANEAIRFKEVAVAEGDQVELKNLGVTLNVLDVPGHTEGHVAYVTDGSLFCGDTLFAGGCGRVFSGTFEQLSASLLKLAKLPAETKVYCAHEYTEANLGFAKWVEPNSAALAERQQTVEDKREADQPTVPSVLKDELATNPFMRTQEPVVIKAAEQWAGESLSSPAAVFRALRTWKDQDYD